MNSPLHHKIVTIAGHPVALEFDPTLNCWFSRRQTARATKIRLDAIWASLKPGGEVFNEPRRRIKWTKEFRQKFSAQTEKEKSYINVVFDVSKQVKRRLGK